MKALYRKYRPLKLAEVVGQEQVTEPLEKALKSGKISHAYLFIGPRGTGKTSVARIFAHEVNGFSYQLEDDYVDIIEIDGASNRGIDNIRELREKALVAPTKGKYKIYIIDEVHMLTREAFNALLKTLEEPPRHVIFIMATTDAGKVPVTIRSRAQVFQFSLSSTEKMREFLAKVAKEEGIKISEGALRIISERGGGSFRDSLSLLDQISTLGSLETGSGSGVSSGSRAEADGSSSGLGSGSGSGSGAEAGSGSGAEISEEMVVRALGLPEEEKIAELLAEYASGDVVKITTILKELLATGVKASGLVEEMITAIIKEPRAELLGLLGKLAEIKEPFVEAKLVVALAGSNCEMTMSARKSAPMNGNVEKNITSAPINENDAEKSEKTIEKDDSSASEITAKTEVESEKQKKMAGEVEAPEKVAKSAERVTKNPEIIKDSTTSFDWDKLLEKMKNLNEVIFMQLKKCEHVMGSGELEIYPRTKIVQNILSSQNNKKVLIGAAGIKVNIHDASEHMELAKNDATIAKISAIMGGEVRNDEGGGSPF